MLYLILFDKQAKDWVDGTRIGYDKTFSASVAGFEPQWHHVYPRSALKKANVSDDKIHALSNITVLNERTHVRKLASKEPAKYIRQFEIPESALRDHLVPDTFAAAVNEQADLERQWGLDRYTDFLLERAQLLAKESKCISRETRVSMSLLVDNPILNSPFEEPAYYWDYREGQPVRAAGRRPVGYYLRAHAQCTGGALCRGICSPRYRQHDPQVGCRLAHARVSRRHASHAAIARALEQP